MYVYVPSLTATSTDVCNTGCLNSWLGDRYCDAVSGQGEGGGGSWGGEGSGEGKGEGREGERGGEGGRRGRGEGEGRGGKWERTGAGKREESGGGRGGRGGEGEGGEVIDVTVWQFVQYFTIPLPSTQWLTPPPTPGLQGAQLWI